MLEYVYNTHTHPTVEEILHQLSQQIPSLSKATVYNNLNTLITAGLIREINIDDHEAHFDATFTPHGHFQCKNCGTISNFEMDIESLIVKGMEGYQISDKDIFFKGLCPNCKRNEKE